MPVPLDDRRLPTQLTIVEARPEDLGPARIRRGHALQTLLDLPEQVLPEEPDGRRADARRAPATDEGVVAIEEHREHVPGRSTNGRARLASASDASSNDAPPGSTTTPLRSRDVVRSREPSGSASAGDADATASAAPSSGARAPPHRPVERMLKEALISFELQRVSA